MTPVFLCLAVASVVTASAPDLQRVADWKGAYVAGVASLYHALRCRKRIRWVQNCEHGWSSPAKGKQETVFTSPH